MRVFSQSLIVYYYQPEEHEAQGLGPRLGVLASKKVGNAVVRNRAKRVFRESFRRLRAEMSDTAKAKSLDIVFIAIRRTRQAKTHDLIDELRAVFKKAGLL